jgi:hypothetical protein
MNDGSGRRNTTGRHKEPDGHMEDLLPNFVRPSEKKKSRKTGCFEKIYILTRVCVAHPINNAGAYAYTYIKRERERERERVIIYS